MIERHSRFSASISIDAPANVDVIGSGMYSLNPRRITITVQSEESAMDAEAQLLSFLERVGASAEAGA